MDTTVSPPLFSLVNTCNTRLVLSVLPLYLSVKARCFMDPSVINKLTRRQEGGIGEGVLEGN
jgi:hypothetical protein